jgi:hypothetical protein
MTIKELITSDFQKVFPSIIGNETGMLSVDDLMDISHEHIVKEINNLSSNNNLDETSELVSLLELVETSELDIEYDSHVHFLLKRFSEKYPDHKSFRFCEFRYVLNTITNYKDCTKDFLTRFYDKVLADHSLMNLADFIQESGFGNSLLLLNEVSDEIVDMLEDAISRYPQKIILLWITAHLYRVHGNLQEAIKYNQLFLEKLQQNSQEEYDLDFVDNESEEMVCYQLADLHFISGSIEESLFYCDKVLSIEQAKENSTYYYDALIIRIRIHMSNKNSAAFHQDYTELIEAISEEELQENYLEIIQYRSN